MDRKGKSIGRTMGKIVEMKGKIREKHRKDR